ncbi:MAG: 4-diphosphocytidyl-2-C-methyl-D-erythritol kinase [Firmicutes bacterium ADurb.Bin193]|nr:MAG: 4-diphosphocytidyl-2-C-methyl-D-erythritol kinase [Firmicutes bacterium ADurb.Bin193]
MIIKAPAKINPALDIVGKRPDGYHSLEMIMQTIALYDEIEITKAEKIEVYTDSPFVPNDERNIAYRAAQAFFTATAIKGGAKIVIHKNIPVGAGLAGGSADAAAVLNGLNGLYGAELSKERLEKIGVTLGADVPFFFTGGTCVAKGLGEVLTPIVPALKGFAVIVKPSFFVSTKWGYQNFIQSEVKIRPDIDRAVSAIRNGDLNELGANMINVLESVTAKKYPRIEEIKKDLLKNGAKGAVMSGSGSAVFGLFEDEKSAHLCADKIKRNNEAVFVVPLI